MFDVYSMCFSLVISVFFYFLYLVKSNGALDGNIGKLVYKCTPHECAY